MQENTNFIAQQRQRHVNTIKKFVYRCILLVLMMSLAFLSIEMLRPYYVTKPQLVNTFYFRVHDSRILVENGSWSTFETNFGHHGLRNLQQENVKTTYYGSVGPLANMYLLQCLWISYLV